MSTLPPWSRDPVSPMTETLTGDGQASLTMDPTYLEQTDVSPDHDGVYLIALPDGTYHRQEKKFFVTKANELTTAPFRVTGTFVGFTSLLFNTIGWSAILRWVGDGWSLVGGNATPEN